MVGLTGSGPIAQGPKERPLLLLVDPTKELLEPRIGLDLLNGIE
jgi:hypothetical protein